MNSKTPNSKISPKMKHSKNKNEDNVNVPAGASPSRKKIVSSSDFRFFVRSPSPSLQCFMTSIELTMILTMECRERSQFSVIYRAHVIIRVKLFGDAAVSPSETEFSFVYLFECRGRTTTTYKKEKKAEYAKIDAAHVILGKYASSVCNSEECVIRHFGCARRLKQILGGASH